MSTLRQKRKKFASVLEKACKQSTSNILDSCSLLTPDPPDEYPESTLTQWHGSTSSTPQMDSLLSMSWPASFLGGDMSCSSQLSPCIDGDSWPSDSSFSCAWNSSSDIEFLEADTADELLSKAISPGQEVTQTSMDLLEFLDDQNHTISHLGACMNMDNPLFTSADNPAFSMFTDLQFDLKPDCLKNDAWLNDPMTSNSDLDDLLMRSTSLAESTPSHQAQASLHQPTYFINDVTKGLSTGGYFHCVADSATKKEHAIPSKDITPAELLFRKERNRLRSKAYRLRRKMQFESMKKEVTQARQKIQEVQKEIQS